MLSLELSSEFMGHSHESISTELMPKPFWSVWESSDLSRILWEVQQKKNK